MDSGNSSGSMQSSSGGDEEYDSRAESSFSAFMINNPPPQSHVGLGPFTISTTTTNSHTLPPHHNTHMLDPLSNYLDPMQRSPSLPNSNALLNLDMMWSKPARSEPNPTDLGGGLIPCSPSQQNQQILLSGPVPGQTRDTSAAFLATRHPLPNPQSASRGLLSVSAANNNDQPHNTNAVRNPKKRSRASRRAPTTVLTTDTTNFRAMVQEFTGIPAPPFTSSPFPRSRLDLFGSAVTTSSTVRSTTLLDPSPPPYLLRPLAQKAFLHHLHPFPPPSTLSFPVPSSNSMVDTLLASSISTNSATNSTSINYQLSSSSSAVDHLGLLKHPLNFNNMQNDPILSFQNILQAPSRYPVGNPSALASKTQPSLEILPPSSGDSHLKVGVLEELGLRHAHVNNDTNVVSGLHQNMVSSPSVGALSSGNNHNNLSNASTEWAQRIGTITNNDCEHGGGSLGGTVNYSDVAERVTNGKAHYSASSSDFRGEKGPENCTVPARSEGMVESWINCSSD